MLKNEHIKKEPTFGSIAVFKVQGPWSQSKFERDSNFSSNHFFASMETWERTGKCAWDKKVSGVRTLKLLAEQGNAPGDLLVCDSEHRSPGEAILFLPVLSCSSCCVASTLSFVVGQSTTRDWIIFVSLMLSPLEKP